MRARGVDRDQPIAELDDERVDARDLGIGEEIPALYHRS